NGPAANAPVRIELEDVTLDNLITGTAGFASGGEFAFVPFPNPPGTTGTASFDFTGDTGTYDVFLTYFDENDGVGTLTVLQNDGQLDTFQLNDPAGPGFPTADNLRTRQVADNILVSNGDDFDVEAIVGGGEFNRIDYIDFIPV
ncbi:MAG: hypothetical protein AAGH45_09250, partial [Pseudomonadota bacterium]